MIDVAPQAVTRVGVLGAGTIGASWTALYVAQGMTCTVWDPGDGAAARIERLVDTAAADLQRIGATTRRGNWSMAGSPADAVRDAQFVQESGPEDLATKRTLYTQIDDALPTGCVLASSTSGLICSDLQEGRRGPERYIVAHPFNPPHLVPLVEVVGGRATAADTVAWTLDFYRAIGKVPIHLKKEVPGHLVNRLQVALWREACHAVVSGLASVEDVDLGISYGPGLRWAIFGPHMTFHLGGGDGGYRHQLEHVGPSMQRWVDDLREAPLTDELIATLVRGVDDEARGRDITALARERDALLVGFLALINRQRAGER